jgi:cell division protein FtsL
MSTVKSSKQKAKKNKVTDKKPSLIKEILSDLLLTHWFLSSLVVLFIASAMLQARTSHETRRAVAKWQSLREQSQQQQIKWQALRLEMSSLTEADRISRLARKQLNMIKVTTENEKIISL